MNINIIITWFFKGVLYLCGVYTWLNRRDLVTGVLLIYDYLMTGGWWLVASIAVDSLF